MKSVLIIDDDRELCELIAEMLGEEGFDVEAANRGERGLGRALAGEHSLVVLDVMMPGMNGFEVLRRLRAEGSDVRVLMRPFFRVDDSRTRETAGPHHRRARRPPPRRRSASHQPGRRRPPRRTPTEKQRLEVRD
ncbi:MAG TPA: response regulator [Pyrinomonadaceae bacterium]|nr:response regulator [Pyrinomonadaceae bacterium]